MTASFQGKIGWKKLRKGENKNYRYISFLPDGEEKIPKKQKNTITAAFQAKICQKKLRKRDNKNYRFVSFLPEGKEKIPKKEQKYSRN